MEFRPPLADHPRLALLASLLVPFLILGWGEPRITGNAPHWPYVFIMSVVLALMSYLVRSRSARFLGHAVIGVSAAGLVLYGYVMAVHGVPTAPTEMIEWGLVIAIPIAGLAFGWWMLLQPPAVKQVK